MVYIILSIIYFIKNKFSLHSVASLLFALLLFSTIAALLTGRLLDLPMTCLFYEIYIGIMLFILFSAWNKYSHIQGADFSDVDDNKLKKIERIITFINGFVFVVDLIVFVGVFALLVAGVINVTEYKNGGDSDLRQTIFASLVPSYFITFAYLFSPCGYFSLALHFYYLIKRNSKKALLHLVLSMPIVLVGVIGLSRSALVNYVIIYSIIFLFIVPLLSRKLFKRAIFSIIIFGSLIGYVFSTITDDRFGESFYIESKSLIDERDYPKLVSILDYFSQWEYFGPMMMDRYSPKDLSWGLYDGSGLAIAIQQKIYGADKVNAARDKKVDRIMGESKTAFHGCITRCIFDYGYTGTLLFILLNCYLIKKFGPNKRKQISFKTLFSMPLLLPFCIGFFSGNTYSELALDMAIIYVWVAYLLCRKKKSKVLTNSNASIVSNVSL